MRTSKSFFRATLTRVSRRRAGVFAVVVLLATGAVVACSSFTGAADDTSAQDAADASTSEPDAPTDTSVASDGGMSCDDFDAAPLPSERMVSCNGETKDLFADPNNCGWCGHSCHEQACDGLGRCVPEPVLDLGAPHEPLVDAIDAQFLYFRDGMDAVLKVPLANPSLMNVVTLASKNDDASTAQLEQIVVGDRVYVRQYGQLAYVDPGASQVTFLTEIGAGGLAAALSTGVVVTEQQSPIDGRVRVYTKDGAPTQTFNAQAGAHDLAVTPDFQRSFWIARGVAGTAPPMAMLSEYTTELVPLGGVALDTFAPNALAADDTTLYLVGPGASISAQPVTATGALFANQLTPGLVGRRTAAITAADGRLYWFASDEAPTYYHADLYSVSRCGGPVVKHLVAGDETDQIGGLQVGADYIYWAKGTQIWRVAK